MLKKWYIGGGHDQIYHMVAINQQVGINYFKLGEYRLYFLNCQNMDKLLSLILEHIQLIQIFICQGGVCNIQGSTMEAKTNDIRRLCVNDGL